MTDYELAKEAYVLSMDPSNQDQAQELVTILDRLTPDELTHFLLTILSQEDSQ